MSNPRNWTVESMLAETVKSGSCRVWIGSVNPDGYGVVRIQGRLTKCSILVWKLANGEISRGLEVCHSCDNPPCIEPSHLFLGTKSDNQIDLVRKGLRPNTILDPDKVREIRRLGYGKIETYGQIGVLFGVSRSTVRAVLERRIWEWVD